MPAARVLGVLLIAAGVFLLWKRPTYPSHQEVVRIGDFKASVEEKKPLPAWLGIAGIAAGVALLLVRARREE